MENIKYEVKKYKVYDNVEQANKIIKHDESVFSNVIGSYEIKKLEIIKKFFNKMYGVDNKRIIIFHNSAFFRLVGSATVYIYQVKNKNEVEKNE